MALAPITTPDVQQSSAPLSPGPIPQAFGASVLGQGLENAGKGAEQVSTEIGATAVHLQTLYNDAEVANRTMSTYDAGSQLGAKFRELKQNAAVQAYPAFRQNIEDLVQKGGEGLPPAALPQYLQQTRRFLMGELNLAASHAAQQGNLYTTNSNEALTRTAGQAMVSAYSPQSEDNFKQTLGKSIGLFATQNGLDLSKPSDQAIARQYSLGLTSKPYYDLASTMINKGGDLTNAAAFLASHRQDIEPDQLRQLDNAMALRTNANNNYTAADIAWHGGAFGPHADFDTFWKTFEVPHEGSALVTDSNGAKVKFGINQADHPEVDVASMTADKAGEIFKKDYTVGGLSAALSYAHADTAFLAGADKAKVLLAQSGGDLDKFMALRTQFLNGLVKDNPAKYGKYADAWAARTRDLQTYISGLPSGPSGILPGLSPPKATDDPDQYEANALSQVAANLQTMFPNDAAERDKALGIANTQIKLAVAPLREQAKATLTALTADAIQNGYQTFEQLQAAHPTEVASLPGTYQKTLMGSVGSIGNQPSTQRLQNEREIVGRMSQLGDNPNAMSGVNLDTLDLTNEARKRLGDQLAKYQNGSWKPDSTADRIAKSPIGVQALNNMHQQDFKGIAKGSTQESQASMNYEAQKNRFIGALADQITAWRANPANQNKIPDDSVVSGFVANVIATQHGGNELAIPADHLAEVDRQIKANGWAFTDYNRGRMYDLLRRNNWKDLAK